MSELEDVRRALRQMHRDLTRLHDRDPEQELHGAAAMTLEKALAEAQSLPHLKKNGIAETVFTVLPPEAFSGEAEPLRVADALVVVGQLIASLPPAPVAF